MTCYLPCAETSGPVTTKTCIWAFRPGKSRFRSLSQCNVIYGNTLDLDYYVSLYSFESRIWHAQCWVLFYSTCKSCTLQLLHQDCRALAGVCRTQFLQAEEQALKLRLFSDCHKLVSLDPIRDQLLRHEEIRHGRSSARQHSTPFISSSYLRIQELQQSLVELIRRFTRAQKAGEIAKRA